MAAPHNHDHSHGADLDIGDLHEQIARLLTNSDQRYTSGRRRLVEVLIDAGRPVTLPEIIELAPDIAQSSAYRNLDILERGEVVQRLTANGDHAYFEIAESLIGHHHHLICVKCGSIADVELDEELERLIDERLGATAGTVGFTPLHHTVDLHGLCAECT